MKKFIGYYDYTVLLTHLALLSSVFGIYYSIIGHHRIAMFCLMFSGLCDIFDGKVARTKKDRTKRQQRFGIQLDSLSDIVCFGVLPTVLGYAVGMRSKLFLIVFILYLMASLTRLAFFNVIEEERQDKQEGSRHVYIGVPVTVAGILFPVLYVAGFFFEKAFPYVYAAFMLIMAFLYVFKLKITRPPMKYMIGPCIIGVATLVLMIVGVHYGA